MMFIIHIYLFKLLLAGVVIFLFSFLLSALVNVVTKREVLEM